MAVTNGRSKDLVELVQLIPTYKKNLPESIGILHAFGC
jgi:hypothetical protein